MFKERRSRHFESAKINAHENRWIFQKSESHKGWISVKLMLIFPFLTWRFFTSDLSSGIPQEVQVILGWICWDIGFLPGKCDSFQLPMLTMRCLPPPQLSLWWKFQMEISQMFEKLNYCFRHLWLISRQESYSFQQHRHSHRCERENFLLKLSKEFNRGSEK